jgi:hypothetical protein
MPAARESAPGSRFAESSQDGIITLSEAIIYLRMSDFRDEDGMTFTERADQLRAFAIGLGIPADRIRVAIENDAGNGEFRPASAYKRRSGSPPRPGWSRCGPVGRCSPGCCWTCKPARLVC